MALLVAQQAAKSNDSYREVHVGCSHSIRGPRAMSAESLMLSRISEDLLRLGEDAPAAFRRRTPKETCGWRLYAIQRAMRSGSGRRVPAEPAVARRGAPVPNQSLPQTPAAMPVSQRSASHSAAVAAVLGRSATTTAYSERTMGDFLATTSARRVESIDAIRGTVMILMALDQVRDFIHSGAMSYSP